MYLAVKCSVKNMKLVSFTLAQKNRSKFTSILRIKFLKYVWHACLKELFYLIADFFWLRFFTWLTRIFCTYIILIIKITLVLIWVKKMAYLKLNIKWNLLKIKLDLESSMKRDKAFFFQIHKKKRLVYCCYKFGLNKQYSCIHNFS